MALVMASGHIRAMSEQICNIPLQQRLEYERIIALGRLDRGQKLREPPEYPAVEQRPDFLIQSYMDTQLGLESRRDDVKR
jgi:hypothetical protein